MSEKEMNINDLPLEMLGHILQFVGPNDDLDNCKLVCQRWSTVATDLRKRITTAAINRLRLGNIAANVIKVDINCQFCRYKNDLYVVGLRGLLYQMYKLNVSSKTLERIETTGALPSMGEDNLSLSYRNELVCFDSRCPDAQVNICFCNMEERRLRMQTVKFPFGFNYLIYLSHEDSLIVYDNIRNRDIFVLDLATMSWWKPKQLNKCRGGLFYHIYTENNDCYFLENSVSEELAVTFAPSSIISYSMSVFANFMYLCLSSGTYYLLYRLTVDVRDRDKGWTWTEMAVENFYQPLLLISSCIVDNCAFCLVRSCQNVNKRVKSGVQLVLMVDFSNALKENKVRLELIELPSSPRGRAIYFLGFTGIDFVAIEGTCIAESLHETYMHSLLFALKS